jgi:hypothetical protein
MALVRPQPRNPRRAKWRPAIPDRLPPRDFRLCALRLASPPPVMKYARYACRPP